MKRFAEAGLAAVALSMLISPPATAQNYGWSRGYGYGDSARGDDYDAVPGAAAAIAEALARIRQRYGYDYGGGFRMARERYAFSNAVSSCGYEAGRDGPVRVTGAERIGADNYAVTGIVGGGSSDDGYDDDYGPRPLAYQPADTQDPQERYYTPRGSKPAPPAAKAPPPRPAPLPAPAPSYQDPPAYDDGGYPDDYADDQDAGTAFSCIARGDGRIVEFVLDGG